jgi:hypothetical protein
MKAWIASKGSPIKLDVGNNIVKFAKDDYVEHAILSKGHWFLVWQNEDGYFWIWESSGMPLSVLANKYFPLLGSRIKRANNYIYQTPDSTTCGYYIVILANYMIQKRQLLKNDDEYMIWRSRGKYQAVFNTLEAYPAPDDVITWSHKVQEMQNDFINDNLMKQMYDTVVDQDE